MRDNLETVIEKLLRNNSASYTLQFWKSGPVILPSVSIDIKKFNQIISQINTQEIKLNILSNLPTTSTELRKIKPMHDIALTSPLLKFKTEPLAKNKSDHIREVFPNAAPSLVTGANKLAAISNFALTLTQYVFPSSFDIIHFNCK